MERRLSRGRLHRRIDAHYRGPSVHRRGRRAARLLRRNAPRRSAGSLGTAATRAAHLGRRNITATPADFGVAPRHRPAARWAEHRWHGRASHRAAAQLDTHRGRLSGQLDAVDRTHAAGTDDHGGAGGRRRRRDERAIRPKPPHSDGGVRPGAAYRLRQRCQPAVGSRRRPARSNRRPIGHGRITRADRHRSAGRMRRPRRRRCARRPGGRNGRGTAPVVAGVCQRDAAADRNPTVAARARLRHRPRRGHGGDLRCRAGMVCDAHQSDRRLARSGPNRRRSIVDRADVAAGGAGRALRRAGRWFDDAGAESGESSGTGLRLHS